ncbi:uncharacterized protein LOC108676520 isoform X2 [Hyalella azteca]|uniref:Uncharacterized protein LOC108676520 isoform X2 n=1 Tax=Hyalella azteca TaxID=294128 RepID=A0A8B7P4U0_HYAAZ|nr:uncharacterized protein LOC108676520 isoform X2 [Hyalella azteca]
MRLIALIFMLYCLYPLHECLGMRHEQELQATRERNGKRKRNTRPLVRDQAKPAAEYDVFDIHAAAQNPGLTFASPPFVSGPSYGAPVTFGGHPDYADGGNLNFGHLNRGSFLPNFGFPDFGNFPRFGSPGAQSQERPYIPPVSKVLKEGINAFLPAGAQKYSNPGISVPSQPTPLEPILKTPGSQNQFDALRQVAVNPLQTAFSAAIKDPSLSPLPFPERKNSKEQTAELTRRVEQDLLAVEKTFTPEEKKTKAVYDKIEGISNPPSIPPIVVSEPRLENKLPVPGDRHKVGEPENYVSHGGFPIRSDSKLSPFQPSPPPAPHTSHASTGITKGGTSPDYGVGQQQDYVSSQKSQETSPQDYVPHQAFPKAAHPGYAAHQTLGTDAPHSPSKILQNEQTAEFVPLQTGPRDTSVEFKSPKIITAENYNDGKQGPILNGQKIPTFTGADLKIERDAFLTPGPKRGEYYPLTRSGGSFPVRNQEILSENQQIEKPTRPEIYDVREASRESSQRESGAYEAPRSSSKFPVIEYKQFAHQPESLSTTEDQHSQVLQSFGLRPLPKPPTTEAPTLFSGTELLSLVQGSHPAKPTAPANDFLTVASTTVQSIRPYLLDPDSDSSLDYDRVEPQKTPTAPTNVFPNDHFKAQSESSHILNTPSVPSAFQVRRQPSPHDKHDVYLNHQNYGDQI